MNTLSSLSRYRELVLPISLIACLGVILVPLPPWIMDILLSANITISVIILLTTIYIKAPLEFNIFPSLLLATTLGRLVLNVATTRLILTRADSDSFSAAGGVIEAFGNFVAGDRLEVGLIIFVIIVLIQFLVITKGATRVSEVAARFALDGMPGRQMAIDADLNSGAIDEAMAQKRRAEVTSQADFYGAMDGASKFVRGDAIAGILITLINIAGGLYVGMMYAGLSLRQSFDLFTKLTIGDGLVSQVPAFLVSLAAALLVTRSTQKVNLPTEFLTQLFSRPQALAVAGGFLILLIFTQLPTLPLLALGGGCVGLAVMLNKQQSQQVAQDAQNEHDKAAEKNKPPEKRPEDFLSVDPMRVEIGAGLLPLADPRRGGDLMDKITGVRSILASEMGILLPKVRLKDKLSLPETVYEIQIAGNLVSKGEVFPDRLLAIDVGNCSGIVEGFETREPAAGRPAVWIIQGQKMQAEMYGYQLATPNMVIATHLQETARKYADELLTRDSTKQLVDQLHSVSPTVVDELIPSVMKLSEVQTVLQMLLREDIPIRQLGLIFETLGDYASRIKDPTFLTEYVRNRLARTICQRYSDTAGQLHVVTMAPAMEDRIAAGFEVTDRGIMIRMSPQAIEITCQQIAGQLRLLKNAGHRPILLVSPRIRPALRLLTQTHLPDLRILSHSEITLQTQTVSVGMVSDPVNKA
ncbi:flagellar biosynthesis protein FlhA [Aureliella helgolandensis]|uniref:Flagellar biosynthesis protein FlhA n=1 Tax=Aureliella helgolandensis TaxID=2527968 RepID=A0A518GET4_9BACT|nr:flagellar biosynthesis protein FlhA [Aureliella helgolandensis]QDV27114.1 Flagellar biosynthesis protein FlhA [Aureliella helgolandensis]